MGSARGSVHMVLQERVRDFIFKGGGSHRSAALDCMRAISTLSYGVVVGRGSIGTKQGNEQPPFITGDVPKAEREPRTRSAEARNQEIRNWGPWVHNLGRRVVL